MCITCDFLTTPLPPHSSECCPLLLRCAYCSTCGLYNAHFSGQCSKRAIGHLSAKAHLNPGWRNANDKPQKSAEKPIFRIVDDEDTFKEYCRTHNLATSNDYRATVYEHLEQRGFQVETYEEGLDEHSLPPSFEEKVEVKKVPMMRKLRCV